MKKFQIVLFILATTVFSACYDIKPLNMGDVDQVEILGLTSKGVDVNLGMMIENPNNVKFKVKGYDLDVYIGDTYLGKAKIKDKVVIPKNSNQHYTFGVSATFGNLLMGAVPLIASLQNKKSAEISVKGEVKVKAWGVSRKIPVDIKQRVPISN